MINLNVFDYISQIFKTAEQIPFDDSSKIILMSDCHRGDGSWSDDFSRNQNLFFSALMYYYKRNYTYIELGDGEELWQSNITDIKNEHSDVYWLMSKFYKEGRLFSLYGNHDIEKKKVSFVKDNFSFLYDEREKKDISLFENIKIQEGLILNYTVTGDKILLIHGHQADFFNNKMLVISRFLVRYFWKPLEIFGVNDPTSPAKNYKKKKNVGNKLRKWSEKEKHMLIAGHTHKPVFPEVEQPLYFNDGSCVHPRCITGIEIADGFIILVKWCIITRNDGTLYVVRKILAGPRKLKDYFLKTM